MKRWPVKRQIKIPAGRSVAFSVGESVGEGAETVTASAAFTGLLDSFTGAAVAFSVGRRLSSTYTGPLIRVRRSSDNAEDDIRYIDSVTAVLNTGALQDFLAGSDGFVTTVYDQSGNARNWTQVTATKQPKIASAGAVFTMGPNLRPAMRFPGSLSASTVNGQLTTAAFTLGADEVSLFMAREREPSAAYQVVITQGNVFGTNARAWHLEESDSFNVNWRPRGGQDPGAQVMGSITGTKAYIFNAVAHLQTAVANFGFRQMRINTAAGGQTLSGSPTFSNTLGTSFSSNAVIVGADANGNNPALGKVGEVLVYGNIAIASASAGIDNNLVTFWGTT